MAKYNFKATQDKEEPKRSSDTGDHVCEVFGCPRLATIKTNNWNCRYHNLRSGDSLAGITVLLKNHEREINWYEKVLCMAYHEYDIFEGNAPQGMQTFAGEGLIQYRVRMAKYIRELLANPTREKHTNLKYTYADNASNQDR